MNRERLAIVITVGAVAVLGVAIAMSAGIGPFADDDGSVGDFPTATETPSAGDGGGGGGGGDGSGDGGDAEETPQAPFATRIDSIESCGETCRDVTATLINQQDREATGVTVYTRIHEGNGTDGDVVWEGSHEVGTLGPGESDTETQRVELGYFDALAIQQNGGWITVVTTIETDQQTLTYQERRDVT